MKRVTALSALCILCAFPTMEHRAAAQTIGTLSTGSAAVDGRSAPDIAHDAQRVVVMDGTFRPSASFPSMAAGYFTIRNDDGVDHLLKGIRSPICKTVIAHHTSQQQTEGANDLFTHLALPHDSTMVFPVSGYHMMCMGIKTMPAEGSRVPFTFDILNGGSITVSFKVATQEQPEQQ